MSEVDDAIRRLERQSGLLKKLMKLDSVPDDLVGDAKAVIQQNEWDIARLQKMKNEEVS